MSHHEVGSQGNSLSDLEVLLLLADLMVGQTWLKVAFPAGGKHETGTDGVSVHAQVDASAIGCDEAGSSGGSIGHCGSMLRDPLLVLDGLKLFPPWTSFKSIPCFHLAVSGSSLLLPLLSLLMFSF